MSGLMVPPNDPNALRQALLWLRSHPEQARSMGDAARLRVEAKFSWPVVVHRCLDIYKRFTTRTLVSAQPREIAFLKTKE